MDLRGGSNNDIIAIGTTDLDYSLVKPGVLKYDSPTKSIYLSTDNSWSQLSYEYLKLYVTAKIVSDGQTFTSAGPIAKVVNWGDLEPENSDLFDPTTGVFKAPRDGIYSFFCNLVFKTSAVALKAEINAYFIAPTFTNQAKKVMYSAGNIPVGIQNSADFDLKKGDTVYLSLQQNLGTRKVLDTNYSTLSILER